MLFIILVIMSAIAGYLLIDGAEGIVKEWRYARDIISGCMHTDDTWNDGVTKCYVCNSYIIPRK